MALKETPIAVIGAGSWGTALASVLGRNGNNVRLWGNEPDVMDAMEAAKANEKYLPGITLPNTIHYFSDLEACLSDVTDVMIVVPSHVFREVLERIKPFLSNDARIAWGTKGVDPKTCQLLQEVESEVLPKHAAIAVLAGPSFAKEVANDLPTAVSLAGSDNQFVEDLIERFHSDRFRVYKNEDLIGVQLCGAVKNILAIAVGIADGLGLGANTRAALITRGLAEMTRLCVALGGKQRTLMSLAGIGDLVLTCTDNQSRNRRYGLALGKGMRSEQALEEIGQAVEGLSNTAQVYELGKKLGVEMPITEQVNGILFRGYSPEDVLAELLVRAPRSE